jgi:hydrogenase maturation protease
LSGILVCGIGSKLQGDDGLGPYVIEELEKRGGIEGAQLADYGISGFKCALNLKGYSKVIFIDAISLPGYEPGRLHIFRIPREKVSGHPMLSDANLSMHETDLPRILASAAVMDTYPDQAVVIGCQPADTSVKLGLSPEVKKAVPVILKAVLKEAKHPV